ncbi:MAG: hypothetical protein M1825_005120 [Sarcosagium campestre]|nr:MAG: hypothetical protein M1825_005120 [Sarcosagium campestre]
MLAARSSLLLGFNFVLFLLITPSAPKPISSNLAQRQVDNQSGPSSQYGSLSSRDNVLWALASIRPRPNPRWIRIPDSDLQIALLPARYEPYHEEEQNYDYMALENPFEPLDEFGVPAIFSSEEFRRWSPWKGVAASQALTALKDFPSMSLADDGSNAGSEDTPALEGKWYRHQILDFEESGPHVTTRVRYNIRPSSAQRALISDLLIDAIQKYNLDYLFGCVVRSIGEDDGLRMEVSIHPGAVRWPVTKAMVDAGSAWSEGLRAGDVSEADVRHYDAPFATNDDFESVRREVYLSRQFRGTVPASSSEKYLGPDEATVRIYLPWDRARPAQQPDSSSSMSDSTQHTESPHSGSDDLFSLYSDDDNPFVPSDEDDAERRKSDYEHSGEKKYSKDEDDDPWWEEDAGDNVEQLTQIIDLDRSAPYIKLSEKLPGTSNLARIQTFGKRQALRRLMHKVMAEVPVMQPMGRLEAGRELMLKSAPEIYMFEDTGPGSDRSMTLALTVLRSVPMETAIDALHDTLAVVDHFKYTLDRMQLWNTRELRPASRPLMELSIQGWDS